MSDLMLFGVLRMPYEMAMGDELSRRQFYSRSNEAADKLEAYGATIEQQAEWPSDADVEGFCESMAVNTETIWEDYSEDEKKACRKATRAALQSVRPPAGVVSEPEWISLLRNELMQSKSTHNFTFTRDELTELLASRHARQVPEGDALNDAAKNPARREWLWSMGSRASVSANSAYFFVHVQGVGYSHGATLNEAVDAAMLSAAPPAPEKD